MSGTSRKAQRIQLWSLATPQMRAFHMSWIAFFLCFFAWFGIAPLMPVVREELGLTKSDVGWCIIGSVAITVAARMLIGWVCDRVGPRLTYTWLLILGSIPVMCIGLAHSPATFLAFRVAIGLIGAAFVVTQYHTTLMFASNCIGTANATTAGWGNLGGGVTQAAMPWVFTMLVSVLGLSAAAGWRVAMVLAGALCLLTGIAYWFFTQDTPEGNFAELRRQGKLAVADKLASTFWIACRDRRVWALFVVYGCCFGMELTLDNIAALYFTDYFNLDLQSAGLAAAAFGMMNLFARALGGIISDRCAATWGLRGRVWWMFLALLGEGVLLIAFSQAHQVALAILSLLAVGLFVKMTNGATYAIVPFVNKQALGSISGIVGAGGNAGAVAAGFLFKGSIPWPLALLILGCTVTCCSIAALGVSFSAETEAEAEQAFTSVRRRAPAPAQLATVAD